jgi:hypothetical protein
MSRYEVCPNCGYKGSMGVKFLSKYPFVTCDKCQWTGSLFDLISKEEYKNKTRTKLIDKMLHEKYIYNKHISK